MTALLREGLRELGLDESRAETLERFAALLLKKNEVMNLTAITERQRQLAEHIELRDGARHRKVIAFPMSDGKFLRPRVNAFHALQPQRTADLLEPRDALAEAVEQRQIEVVLENTQRHREPENQAVYGVILNTKRIISA